MGERSRRSAVEKLQQHANLLDWVETEVLTERGYRSNVPVDRRTSQERPGRRNRRVTHCGLKSPLCSSETGRRAEQRSDSERMAAATERGLHA